MFVTIVLLMLSIFTLILVAENRSLINDIKIRTNNLVEEQTNLVKEIEIMKNNQSILLESSTTSEPKWRDPKYVAFVNATWRIETGNGTSQLWLEYNNPGGIKCGSEYCFYDSQKSGLEALNSLLIEYWEVYGMDIKAIRQRYCQCGDDDFQKFMEIYNEELKKEQR